MTVTGDGYTLYSSPAVYGDTAPAYMEIDVSGVDEVTVRLEVTTHDSTEYNAALLDFLVYKSMDDVRALLEPAE